MKVERPRRTILVDVVIGLRPSVRSQLQDLRAVDYHRQIDGLLALIGDPAGKPQASEPAEMVRR
ncbi:MAG: hypothetical protein ABI407_22400 [Bradyrhizobium sp.]